MNKERYPKEWSHLPSVTQVLDIIAKPGLIWWYKSKSKEEIERESKKATDIGTELHAAIQSILLGKKVEIQTEHASEIKAALQGFLNWRDNNGFKTIDLELKMFSDKLGYKGTLDWLAEKRDGKIALIDWKTIRTLRDDKGNTKPVYKENKLQVGAYKRLYEFRFDIKIDELWVVRLAKDRAEADPVRVTDDQEDLNRAFDNALGLYNWYHQKEVCDAKDNDRLHG